MSAQTEFISFPNEAVSLGWRYLEEGADQAGPSLIAKTKSFLGKAWGWLAAAPARAWGWLKRTLHLEPAIAKSQAGWVATKSWLARFAAALGVPGMAGAGLLMVSTRGGRKVLHTAFAPLRWAGSLLGAGWRNTSTFFADNLGGFGDWVAARMGDVEEFLFGTTTLSTQPYRLGVLTRVKVFWDKHIAGHLHHDSKLMAAARIIGALLFGIKLIIALPAIGIGGALLTVLTWIGWAALAITVAVFVFALGVVIASKPKVRQMIDKAEAEIARDKDVKAAAKAATEANKPRMAHTTNIRDDIKDATEAVRDDIKAAAAAVAEDNRKPAGRR